MLLLVGTCGTETGVGFAAEIWQHEVFADASQTIVEGAFPLIIGQLGVQAFAADICNQHEATVEAGNASTITSSDKAMSLNRHIIFFKVYYGAGPACTVTEVTATCNHAHYEHCSGFICCLGAWETQLEDWSAVLTSTPPFIQ